LFVVALVALALLVMAGAPLRAAAPTTAGQLYAFGLNEYGQLGSATNNGTTTANPTPVLVGLPGVGGPVTEIAAGAGHSLAVTSTGQLYAFGYNDSGQLGSATNSGTLTANPTPVLVGLPAGTTIDTVARGASADHTLALVADLAVASGSLAAGQVGVSYNTTVQAKTAEPVHIPGRRAGSRPGCRSTRPAGRSPAHRPRPAA
jgi:alpha-tubulin suppressor-like RCC1 family protein